MSSSPCSFQGDQSVSGSASQEGLGKLPAVEVGNNMFLVNLLKTEILNNKNLNSKINVQIDGFNDLTHIDLV